MTAAKSRTVQKIELMRDLIRPKLNGGKSATASFSYFNDLQQQALLDGPIGLKDVLDTLATNSDGQITYTLDEQPQLITHHRHATSDPETWVETGPLVLVGVTVLVKEPQQLKKIIERVIAKVTKTKFNGKKIQSIEVIKNNEESKVTFILNEDVNRSLKLSLKKLWGKLADVAEDGSAYSDDPQIVADYFNTNKACPIYKRFDYELTDILIVDGDRLRPAPGVKIYQKTKKTVSQRKNKVT